jgi:hypothetical protein
MQQQAKEEPVFEDEEKYSSTSLNQYQHEREEAKKVEEARPKFIEPEDKPKAITPSKKDHADRLKFENVFSARNDRNLYSEKGRLAMLQDWDNMKGRTSQTAQQWYVANKTKYMKTNPMYQTKDMAHYVDLINEWNQQQEDIDAPTFKIKGKTKQQLIQFVLDYGLE